MHALHIADWAALNSLRLFSTLLPSNTIEKICGIASQESSLQLPSLTLPTHLQRCLPANEESVSSSSTTCVTCVQSFTSLI